MRRSDFDITDTIRTTDPIEVGDAVIRLFHGLFPHGNPRPARPGPHRSFLVCGAGLRGSAGADLTRDAL